MFLFYFLEMSPTNITEIDVRDHLQSKAKDDCTTFVEPCMLPKDVQEVALNELRENESIRTQSLLAFRQWISKNTDIENVNCGTINDIKYTTVPLYIIV